MSPPPQNLANTELNPPPLPSNPALKQQIATIKLPTKSDELSSKQSNSSEFRDEDSIDIDSGGRFKIDLESEVSEHISDVVASLLGIPDVHSQPIKLKKTLKPWSIDSVDSEGDMSRFKKGEKEQQSTRHNSVHIVHVGLKECNSLIASWISKARKTDDEEVRLEQKQNLKAYELFRSIRDSGSTILEETYGPFLEYLIDFGMDHEFYMFSYIFKHENTAFLARLAYYEMRLCIVIEDKDRIQELLYEYSLKDDSNRFLFEVEKCFCCVVYFIV